MPGYRLMAYGKYIADSIKHRHAVEEAHGNEP